MASGLPEGKMSYYQKWRGAAIRHLTALVCIPYGLANQALPKHWVIAPTDGGHHHRNETAVMNRVSNILIIIMIKC
jgi:hypothetical protein